MVLFTLTSVLSIWSKVKPTIASYLPSMNASTSPSVGVSSVVPVALIEAYSASVSKSALSSISNFNSIVYGVLVFAVHFAKSVIALVDFTTVSAVTIVPSW